MVTHFIEMLETFSNLYVYFCKFEGNMIVTPISTHSTRKAFEFSYFVS